MASSSTPPKGGILEARAVLFNHVGKAALLTGMALAKVRAVADVDRKAMAQEARDRVISDCMKGTFSLAEAAFRRLLLDAHAYDMETLPECLHPPAPDAPGPQPTSAGSQPTDYAVAALGNSPGSDDVSAVQVDDAALTAAAVLHRLGIEAVGHTVMVRPNASMTISGEPAGAEVVKLPVSTLVGTLDALELPCAIVTIAGADGATKQSFRVLVDDLIPTRAKAEKAAAPVEASLVPAESATLVVPAIDYQSFGATIMRSVALYSLNSMLCASAGITQGLQILLLSPADAIPFRFQVRATRAFKKGDLILCPWVSPACAAPFVPSGSQPTGALDTSKTCKIVDETLRSSAKLHVRGEVSATQAAAESKSKPKGKAAAKEDEVDAAGSQPTDAGEEYIILSPLLQGKNSKQRAAAYSNLAPFWAVTRCPKSPGDSYNMAAQTVAMDFAAPKDRVGTRLKPLGAGPKWSASLEVMINTKAVKAGEVLTLPFNSD